MAKREFLMLAHTYEGKENIGGWYVSEKLDGVRAYWDGGITRGIPAANVAWANTAKDARLLSTSIATGLWSRYGKPLQAPDWWLDKMPHYPLDGELFIERGQFQTLISIVKKLTPSPAWNQVKYKAFDVPFDRVIFANGEINNTNFKKTFTGISVKRSEMDWPKSVEFKEVYKWMCFLIPQNNVCQIHQQHLLEPMTIVAKKQVDELLRNVIRQGGEGLILRAPHSFWVPQRTRTLLKVKGMLDAEAIVVGYTFGRETELGSKLLGKMGALIVTFNGLQFELSGFTDEERVLCGPNGNTVMAIDLGISNPGSVTPDYITNPRFPRGSKVTFRYRELTDRGCPKEARYHRNYESI